MFSHWLAGAMIFFIFAELFDFEINRTWLIIGAFCGLLPDPISYILSRTVNFKKWGHSHRDNLSHSLLLPVIALLVCSVYDFRMAIVISIAILSHLILDLFGIGWGVKLFYPISNKTFKLFYRGRILRVWNQEEVDTEVRKFGDDDWVRNILFRFNLIGICEWLSLTGFVVLIILH